MAAMTTAPELVFVGVRKDLSLPNPYIITTIWRARYLATGEPVELRNTFTRADPEMLGLLEWNYQWGAISSAWTTLTGDDAHTVMPFDVYDA